MDSSELNPLIFSSAEIERIEKIATDIWHYVFEVMENEAHYNGIDAGSVAGRVKREFVKAISDLYN